MSKSSMLIVVGSYTSSCAASGHLPAPCYFLFFFCEGGPLR